MENKAMENKEIIKNTNNTKLMENNSNNTINERDITMKKQVNKTVENKTENSATTGSTKAQSITLEEAIKAFKAAKSKEQALEKTKKIQKILRLKPKKLKRQKLLQKVRLKKLKKVKMTMTSAIKNHQRSINFRREKVEILLGVRKSQSLDH